MKWIVSLQVNCLNIKDSGRDELLDKASKKYPVTIIRVIKQSSTFDPRVSLELLYKVM